MLEPGINIFSLHPFTRAVAAFPWFCCYEFLQGSVASGSMHVHIGVVFRTRTARQILALLPLSSGCHAAGSETDARPSSIDLECLHFYLFQLSHEFTGRLPALAGPIRFATSHDLCLFLSDLIAALIAGQPHN